MSVEQTTDTLRWLAARMRKDSEQWFPQPHDAGYETLTTYWALGLAGEAGEVADLIKKWIRHGYEDSPEWTASLGQELSDVFVYLLLLADEWGFDLIAEHEAKRNANQKRWGSVAVAGSETATEEDDDG
jgi:NTP pyrophosphatase (non-canonical NTP hydrolase)